MESTRAVCVVIPFIQPPAAIEIEHALCLYKILSPYKPLMWGIALHEAGFLYSFPNLIFDITNSAPIGNPPPLTYTFIPKNIKSAEIEPAYMDDFLVAEVASGRINGPFSIAQAHSIFGSHFCTTPLGLVEKPGSDTLHMICHHSKKDCYGQSTNGWLDPAVNATDTTQLLMLQML